MAHLIETKDRRSVYNRAALWAVIAAASVIAPTAAWAQQTTPAPTTPPPGQEETIVVTGTRIQRPDYQFSNPVVSTTAEEIHDSGTNNLLQYLEQIPALNNSLNGTEAFPNAGFTGVDLLDLRNLGTNRTLVLVDGKRHVSGLGGTSAVDVSTIPTDLVERVDVLTGGASAIYGADGVSGVVNFIMRDDFTGLRLRAEAGAPRDGGQSTQFASATWGTNFAGSRGNIAASLEYNNQTRLRCVDRNYCSNEIRFVTNPDISAGTYPAGAHGPYARIPLGGLRWFSSGPGGAVDTDGDIFIANFDGRTDAPWDFGTDFDPPNGLFDIDFTYAQGGSATPTANYTDTLLPSKEQLNFNVFGHYDFNDNMRLYAQFKAVNSSALNIIQPTFDYGYAINVAENPYVPTNIANDAIANGQPLVFVTRDQFDLGYNGEEITQQTYRAVVGLSGHIFGDVNYDVSYVKGRLDSDFTSVNTRFEDRFAAAIDVVDPDGPGPQQPTCRVNVDPAGYAASFNLVDRNANTGLANYPAPLSFTPGQCIPLNTFGVNVASAAARDWIMGDLHTQTTVDQDVFTAAFNGELPQFFRLPGGNIGWAAGIEYRREALDATPDQFSQIGVTQSGPTPISRGDYEVKEAFAELSLPLLKDAPFAYSLSVDWAHRYSEYSTLGSTNTWKFGVSYSPVADLTFRATRAEAVRAPNINELFAPSAITFQFITDPCRGDQLANAADPALRTANCTTLLTAAGANPVGFVDPFAAFTKTGHAGGNSNLGAETADTDTFGIIYRPSFIHGLTLSADYYDIVLQNAINFVDPQDIADHCVDAPTVVNPFCAAITRQVGGAGAGGIVDFLQAPFNVAEFTTRGIDFTVAYTFDPSDWGMRDIGTFDVRAVGNNTQELTFVPLVGADTVNSLGESGARAPEWQLNFDVTWHYGKWTTHYGYNFTTDMLRYTNLTMEIDPDHVAPQYKYVDGLRSHSIQVRYNITDDFEAYIGANNLGYSIHAGDPYIGDPNGQFFYAGIAANF